MPKYDEGNERMDVLMEAIAGRGLDVSIPRAEKLGQRKLIISDDLPIKMYPSSALGAVTEKTGIIFGEEINDLFRKVTLPAGWSKQLSSHGMWSYLLDNKNRQRASIFYKAAFYDRDAFLRWNNFVYLGNLYHDTEGNPQYIKGSINPKFNGESQVTIRVINREEVILYTFGTFSCNYTSPHYEEDSRKHLEAEEQARAWIKLNYPSCDDCFAYWD